MIVVTCLREAVLTQKFQYVTYPTSNLQNKGINFSHIDYRYLFKIATLSRDFFATKSANLICQSYSNDTSDSLSILYSYFNWLLFALKAVTKSSKLHSFRVLHLNHANIIDRWTQLLKYLPELICFIIYCFMFLWLGPMLWYLWCHRKLHSEFIIHKSNQYIVLNLNISALRLNLFVCNLIIYNWASYTNE